MKKYVHFLKHPVVILSLLLLVVSPFLLTITLYQQQITTLTNQTKTLQKDLKALQTQDQYVINKDLEKQIKAIETTYQNTVAAYEKMLDLNKDEPKEFDKLFASTLSLLAKRNYASAEAELKKLTDEIEKENKKTATGFSIPANVTTSNTAPSSGHTRQQVKTDSGTHMVDIIAGDLSSTKVIVDTASDSDCKNDCPVLSVADYVARSGAYAGINGSYFCPTAYPSCAGKTNSFDLLVMNKNKHYFNSDNNVYSTNPAVIFMNGSVRFVSQALGWGRDTGVDGVLSNFPLLVSGNNIVYSDSSDPKFNSVGPRNFVANKGNIVYIGTIYNATMGDSAKVLKALGMENAMNLDEGGSTALWFGGRYLIGPGRNVPNAILFVRK